MLCADWRRLYPLRHSHGGAIREVLAGCPEAGAEARAAFGLDQVSQAADWLYRDFYVEAPPPRPSIDRAIGRLRRGDPAEMRALLAEPVSDSVLQRAWCEASTLAGLLAGMPRTEPAGRAARAPASNDDGVFSLCSPLANGGAGIVNRVEIAARVQAVLDGPLGIEAHRQRMLRSLHLVLGGDMDRHEAATCMLLLIHHTDLPLHQPLQLERLGRRQAAGLYRALISLQGWLRDPVRFGKLLRDGLSSPSRQRRFLSYRLLRFEGQASHELHPDDAATPL